MNRRNFLKSLGVAIAAFQSFKLDAAQQALHVAQFKRAKHALLMDEQWELAEQHEVNSYFSHEGICQGRTVYDGSLRLAHGYKMIGSGIEGSVTSRRLDIYTVDDLERRECLPSHLAQILRELHTDIWTHKSYNYACNRDNIVSACDEWVYYRVVSDKSVATRLRALKNS